jgi:hypothetical protein
MLTKKKTAILALALIFCIGIASAAVLEYFGRIVTTVYVKQAVLLDGQDITEMPIPERFNISGGETVYTSHWLESQTSVPVALMFHTDYYPDSGGITVTYLKPVGYSYSKDWSGLGVTVTDDGEWLTWTYTYAASPTHKPKMTVAINYPHGFCITTFDDGSHDGWYYSPDPYSEATTVRLGDYSGVTTDWVKTTASSNVLTVAIKKTALPDTFLWHGYANYNGQQVWIETDASWQPTGQATIREPITSPFTLQPSERLDFYIKYEFATNITPDIYTITIEVRPA